MRPPLTRRAALRTAGGLLTAGLLAGCSESHGETVLEIRVRSIVEDDVELTYRLRNPETGTELINETAVIPGGKHLTVSYMLTNTVTIPHRIDSNRLELEAGTRRDIEATGPDIDNSVPVELDCDTERIEIRIDQNGDVDFADSSCR